MFCAQIPDCPSKFQNQFYSYIHDLTLRTYYNHCCFTKIMIRRAQMGSICQPLNPGIRSTEYTDSIQYVDVQDPQIHEVWILGLYNITHEDHPTARVEEPARTVGYFVTD